eukprot:15475267-Alexandrium_andersonii.AAC.1
MAACERSSAPGGLPCPAAQPHAARSYVPPSRHPVVRTADHRPSRTAVSASGFGQRVADGPKESTV